MKIIGKILWWDKKDENGIIVDAQGNEYYFDVSVIDGRKSSPKQGTLVIFKINESINETVCAKSVLIPTERERNKLEKEFQRNLQSEIPL